MGRKRGFVDMDNAKAILEGLLFLSGEEGLSIDQMMLGLKNLEMDDIRVLLDTLKEEYSSNSRGIELVEYANRFKFVTKEFIYPYGKQLFEEYKHISFCLGDDDKLDDLKKRMSTLMIEEFLY